MPVHLSGPFEAIDWKIQWSAVAAGAVQNKLEGQAAREARPEGAGTRRRPPRRRRAQTPKDKLKEKLLKGLFK